MRKVRLRFLSLGALISAFYCAYLPAQQTQSATIVGQVRVSRGSFPTQRLEVILETRGIRAGTTYTDDEGRFTFSELPGNLYHVTINEKDYYPVHEMVAVNPLLNRTNVVQIYLTPRTDRPAALAPPDRLGTNGRAMTESAAADQRVNPQVRGNNPYLLNPAEYNKKFSKDVLKEFEKGAKRDKDGEIEGAIEHYRKALKLAPNFYPAHNNLGSNYLRKQQFAEAQTEFEAAIKLNPAEANAYFNLGNVLLLTRKYVDSERAIQDGLRRQPDSAFGQFLAGAVSARLGKSGEAERQLQTALQMDPSISQAHLELVNLYLQQQKKMEAIAHLQTFVKSFPDNPQHAQAKQVLKRLQKETNFTEKAN
jgi:Tfp pilus assembly protein PilF